MHYGNSIDPFPLFVLALVLGWIYQRTHRLWPCVSLHMALNSISVAMLFLARRPA
jgi:membrane protease YdiL (CAAX protease family)